MAAVTDAGRVIASRTRIPREEALGRAVAADVGLFHEDHALAHHRIQFGQEAVGFRCRQHDADLDRQVGREVDDAVGGHFAALVAAGDAARDMTAGGDLPPLTRFTTASWRVRALPAGLLAGEDGDRAVCDAHERIPPGRDYALRAVLGIVPVQPRPRAYFVKPSTT